MFQKILLVFGTVVLSIGFLVLFFGGTWDGARIGLEILGAILVLQTSYSVIVQYRNDERKNLSQEELQAENFLQGLKEGVEKELANKKKLSQKSTLAEDFAKGLNQGIQESLAQKDKLFQKLSKHDSEL